VSLLIANYVAIEHACINNPNLSEGLKAHK
jgi:hypothetical protein